MNGELRALSENISTTVKGKFKQSQMFDLIEQEFRIETGKIGQNYMHMKIYEEALIRKVSLKIEVLFMKISLKCTSPWPPGMPLFQLSEYQLFWGKSIVLFNTAHPE